MSSAKEAIVIPKPMRSLDVKFNWVSGEGDKDRGEEGGNIPNFRQTGREDGQHGCDEGYDYT